MIDVGSLSPARQVLAAEVEKAMADKSQVGHLGAHTVKVIKPSTASVQEASQAKASLVDAFLCKSDAIGKKINEYLAKQGLGSGSLEYGSKLSEEINSRVSNWIDTICDLQADGVLDADIDKAGEAELAEMMKLVDEAFAQSEAPAAEAPAVKAKVAEAPAAETEVAEAKPMPDKVVSVAAEKNPPLKEASAKYAQRAAKGLSEATGKPVDPAKTHVYENIGGGSCFFHSVLQLLAKCDPAKHPVGNTVQSANGLRAKLIDHFKEVKSKLEEGEAHGLHAVYSKADPKQIQTVLVKTEVSEFAEDEDERLNMMLAVTEGYELAQDQNFAEYEECADVATAAFMADYLKRPVLILTQEDDNGKMSIQPTKFEYGLVSGQKLEGEPLVIYYDKGIKHFMAVEMEG